MQSRLSLRSLSQDQVNSYRLDQDDDVLLASSDEEDEAPLGSKPSSLAPSSSAERPGTPAVQAVIEEEAAVQGEGTGGERKNDFNDFKFWRPSPTAFAFEIPEDI